MISNQLKKSFINPHQIKTGKLAIGLVTFLAMIGLLLICLYPESVMPEFGATARQGWSGCKWEV